MRQAEVIPDTTRQEEMDFEVEALRFSRAQQRFLSHWLRTLSLVVIRSKHIDRVRLAGRDLMHLADAVESRTGRRRKVPIRVRCFALRPEVRMWALCGITRREGEGLERSGWCWACGAWHTVVEAEAERAARMFGGGIEDVDGVSPQKAGALRKAYPKVASLRDGRPAKPTIWANPLGEAEARQEAQEA
jgi:hypothetical protein